MNKAVWVILLLLVFLTGCAPVVRSEQAARDGFVELSAGSSLGQTFLARYQGLSGVALYLQPGAAGTGRITFHLRKGPQGDQDLAVASLALADIDSPRYYRLDFAPQEGSFNQDYYFHLEVEGRGSVKVATAPGNLYANGALYHNQEPQEAQSTFRLAYDLQQALAGLLGEGLIWLVRLAAGIFLFIVPGWSLLHLLMPGWRHSSWGEKAGLSAGISLAFYPVLLLWTGLVGLRLGPLYAWGPPLAGLAYLAWRSFTAQKRSAQGPDSTLPAARSRELHFTAFSLPHLTSFPRFTGVDLALLLALGLVFAVRFWVIRSLDAPMWGDSYQHTLIARLLVDNGGLFRSWQPYAELETFTYHFGFHAAVAVFHWVTRLALPQATLWTGQILNGLAILALVPLAVRMGRSRWAGVAAVLAAGLLSPMPMYYTNWGRYTQLAGQVILPALMYCTWLFLDREKTDWRLPGLMWIALGGLALTHYRVLILAILFMGAALLLYINRLDGLRVIKKTALAGLGGGLLFLPWFIRVFGGKTLTIFASQISTPASRLPVGAQESNAIGELAFYLPLWLWIIAPLLVGWGLWRRQKLVAVTGLWSLLALLSANPNWLDLPGLGSMSNLTVFIAAYIPASLFLGATAGWAAASLESRASQASTGISTGFPGRLRSKNPLAVSLVLLALTAGIGVWGARVRVRDVRPEQHAMVTRPDLRAAAWIRENLPQEALFLVNSFTAYADTTVVGSDAGWWLPLLAGRSSTLPPMNYGFEQEPWPGYREEVLDLTHQVLAHGANDPAVVELLRERRVTHIYIGQLQGSVNTSATPVLQPDRLLASPFYQPVYHQDRVWVFALKP